MFSSYIRDTPGNRAKPAVRGLYLGVGDPSKAESGRLVSPGSLEERGIILLLERYAEWDLPPGFHDRLVAMFQEGRDSEEIRWLVGKLTPKERDAMDCLLLANEIAGR